MNKKGFTLVELLATIVIISLIMSLVLPSALRLSQENSDTIYHEYESMMEEYAAISDYKDQDIIHLSDLQELNTVKKECKGYVVVDHTSSNLEYKAYISCGDKYITDGYDNDYDKT